MLCSAILTDTMNCILVRINYYLLAASIRVWCLPRKSCWLRIRGPNPGSQGEQAPNLMVFDT